VAVKEQLFDDLRIMHSSICEYVDWLTNLHKQLEAMGKSMPNAKYALLLMGLLLPLVTLALR